MLSTQPHYIKGMKIDCKIAIPKELLNNTDTPLGGAKAKESICVTGNIIDNSNSNNNKSKLKKKHKGINDKQKHNCHHKSFVYIYPAG